MTKVFLVWVDGQKGSTQHLTKGDSGYAVRQREAAKYGRPVAEIVAHWVQTDAELATLAGILRDF